MFIISHGMIWPSQEGIDGKVERNLAEKGYSGQIDSLRRRFHVPVTAWRTIFLCFEADGRDKYYFHCCCGFSLLSTIIGGILFSFPNVEANQLK